MKTKSQTETLILIDFDGTIADTAEVMMDVGNEVLAEYGMEPVPDTEFEQMREMSVGELMKKFPVPIRKIPAVVTSVRKSLKQRIDVVEPVVGMLELIQEYAKRSDVSVALLSSNSSENVEFFLKKYKIYDCFEDIHADVGLFSKYVKIRKVSRRAGRGKKVLSIGDEARDVEAARVAGVTSIAVTWGLNSQKKLEHAKADHVVTSVSELHNVIESYLDS